MHAHAVQWSEMRRLLLLLAIFVLLARAAAFSRRSPGTGTGATTTTVVKAAHLLCFATSWGSTVWSIFVGGGGLVMNLPRHTMVGSLRGKVFVFPACLALSAACTAAAAAAFAWLHRPWTEAPPAERRQLAVLLAAAGFDLANLLIFNPRTLKKLQERHKVERILGIGGEGSIAGWRQNARPAARSSAALAAENVRFRVAHSFSAAAIITSAAGLVSHSCYLSGKIAI